MSQQELLDFLRARGVRIDSGGLWTYCFEHGVAQLDGDQYLLVGSAEARAAEASTRQPPKRPGAGHETAVLRGLMDLEPAPAQRSFPYRPEWTQVGAEIVRALADERAKVIEQRVHNDYDIEHGELLSSREGRLVVRYEVVGDSLIKKGGQATLIVGRDRDHQVPIVSAFGDFVVVAGANIPVESHARLRVDLSWLLTTQQDRAAALKPDSANFNWTNALLVCGELAQATRTPAKVRAWDRGVLNERQQVAVDQAIRDGVTWLWGPPGTGKTTTISSIVSEMVDRGKRVLVAAPTNAAVDVAFTSLMSRVKPTESGRVVRLGAPADEDLARRFAVPVVVDEIAAQNEPAVQQRWAEAAQEISELRGELRRLGGSPRGGRSGPSQRAISDLNTRIDDLQELMGELRRMMHDARITVCRRADVVATTCHQVLLDTLKGELFDCVILDEAGMISASMAALVAGVSVNHVVVAGDFRQLPPVVVSDTPMSHKWLLGSPFERAGIPAALASGAWPDNVVALNQQHRMDRDISDMISEVFYPENTLVTARSVETRRHPVTPSWAQPDLSLIDTTDLQPTSERRQGLSSRFNVAHAQLAAALVASRYEMSIGVTSPFAAQARLFSGLLYPESEELTGSTVHRFQGGERDLVVFDTVEARHGITRMSQWFLQESLSDVGPRLLNVAASRAKHSLVVIADLAAWDLARPTVPNKFMRHLTSCAQEVPWRALLELPGSPTQALSDDEAIGALRADLLSAQWVEARIDDRHSAHFTYAASRRDVASHLGDLYDKATVWMQPDQRGQFNSSTLRLHQQGVNLRAVSRVRGTTIVTPTSVWSAVAPEPGAECSWLRTEHANLASATNKVLMRRHQTAPGSRQLQETCSCGRLLVRHEQVRSTRYECPKCGDGRRRR